MQKIDINQKKESLKTYLKNYSISVIKGLSEELKYDMIKEILIFKKVEDSIADNICEHFKNAKITNGYKENLGKNYDLVISFNDIVSFTKPEEDIFIIKSLLSDDGVFIGCFFGGNTLYATRSILWEIESELNNKFSARINPMIKLPDFMGLLQYLKFSNIIAFDEKIEREIESLEMILKLLQEYKEYRAISECEIMPKLMYDSIKRYTKTYNEFFDIIGFCASKSTKLFASKLNI